MPKTKINLAAYPFIPMPEKFLDGKRCGFSSSDYPKHLGMWRDKMFEGPSWTRYGHSRHRPVHNSNGFCHLEVVEGRRVLANGASRPGLVVAVHRCQKHAIEELEPKILKGLVVRHWGSIGFEWRPYKGNHAPGSWSLAPVKGSYPNSAYIWGSFKRVPTEEDKIGHCEQCGRGEEILEDPKWSEWELGDSRLRGSDSADREFSRAILEGARKARRASDLPILFDLFPEIMNQTFYAKIIAAEKKGVREFQKRDEARARSMARIDALSVRSTLSSLSREVGKLR